MASGNLYEGLPKHAVDREISTPVLERPSLRIERIVSTGQATPEGEWYDQDTDEWVLLVAGAARLRIEGDDEDRDLVPGDWVLLPAHCRHRVTWTQSVPPTVWLAVHFAAGRQTKPPKPTLRRP
jgi:cupin 2 domain-containing protein